MFLPKVFGKFPTGERLEKIRRSPNYINGSFQNISKTEMMAEGGSFFKVTRDFINRPRNATPPGPLPSEKTDLNKLPEGKCSVVWFGHSSYLIRINNKNVLVDPVLTGNASPFTFMIKAFEGADIYKPEDLPAIDILLITHDHYDHLDYRLISKLKDKFSKVVCSLGVGAHLEYWGISTQKITELDWSESCMHHDIRFTAETARHFSGRATKRGQSLWSSFIIKTSANKIFAGGDSGYDKHFNEIGKKYGPFDLALLECGQYNTSWPQIHMMPEESVIAAVDLNAKVLLPVHWGKFSLAMHAWDEPIKRVMQKAIEKNVEVTTPLIGQVYTIGENIPKEKWWEKVKVV